MTGQSKNTNVQEYLGTAYHRKDVGWLVHVVNTEEKQTLKQSTNYILRSSYVSLR